MRKLLLATSALVAFAGAAQAAESPIQVTVGGDVKLRAVQFSETTDTNPGNKSYDFETEYTLQFAAEGKAANGIDYGALVSMTNDSTYVAAGNTLGVDQAYVWMSGNFGKVVLGDSMGASSMFMEHPSVGEGQINGEYADFLDGVSAFTGMYARDSETDTKVTYFTPKVGNEDHKVQLGVSFSPEEGNMGTTISTNNTNNYGDVIEAVAKYTGSIKDVDAAFAAMIKSADTGAAATARDYTAWGLSAEAAYAGFTLGGSYYDAGSMGTTTGMDNDQFVFTAGLTYEIDNMAFGLSGEHAKGYNAANAYVKGFDALSVGAEYTWFPGMTTCADATFFKQDNGAARDNEGHVLMLSQKLTF